MISVRIFHSFLTPCFLCHSINTEQGQGQTHRQTQAHQIGYKDRQVTHTYIHDRLQREREDTRREVENLNLGSFLVKLNQEEVSVFIPCMTLVHFGVPSELIINASTHDSPSATFLKSSRSSEPSIWCFLSSLDLTSVPCLSWSIHAQDSPLGLLEQGQC